MSKNTPPPGLLDHRGHEVSYGWHHLATILLPIHRPGQLRNLGIDFGRVIRPLPARPNAHRSGTISYLHPGGTPHSRHLPRHRHTLSSLERHPRRQFTHTDRRGRTPRSTRRHHLVRIRRYVPDSRERHSGNPDLYRQTLGLINSASTRGSPLSCESCCTLVFSRLQKFTTCPGFQPGGSYCRYSLVLEPGLRVRMYVRSLWFSPSLLAFADG